MRIVYLGNWLANATRDNSADDPRLKEFDEIENYVFSYAHQFGFETLIERDTDDERWFPTRMFEESLEDEIDSYDEETFWEELFYRLSDRDFWHAYNEADIHRMPIMERLEKEEPFRKKWDEEINEHGLERLEVVNRELRPSPLSLKDL